MKKAHSSCNQPD
jgi:hypothetical protein